MHRPRVQSHGRGHQCAGGLRHRVTLWTALFCGVGTSRLGPNGLCQAGGPRGTGLGPGPLCAGNRGAQQDDVTQELACFVRPLRLASW